MALTKTDFAAALKVTLTAEMNKSTLFKPAVYSTFDATQKKGVDDAIEAFATVFSEAIADTVVTQLTTPSITQVDVIAGVPWPGSGTGFIS